MANISCPFCGFGRSWAVRGKKRKCRSCRREFGGSSYPVAGFRLTVTVWRKAIATFLRERTEVRIAEESGVSLKTAQKIAHHFRIIMSKEVPEVFQGAVEMDEAYIGGQRKNKRLHIRRIQGKRGHGTDKLPIVGLFSRNAGKVYVVVEPKKLDVKFIFGTIEKRVALGARILTDGFLMYRALPTIGYIHEYVDHAGGEYVRGDVHTNNIEGFWGIMKRKLGCIGGMRRGRLHLFVAEIVWKFNHRNESLLERERALARLVFRR
jgi:transposase-like protein